MATLEQIIKDYINDNEKQKQTYKGLFNRYNGKNLPIEQKTMSKSSKANNKIKSDFRGIIVDQAVGYLFGKPVNVGLDNLRYTPELFEIYNREVQNFLTRNNFDDLTAEAGTMLGSTGFGAFLAYLNLDGKPCVMNVPSWQCIFIENTKDGSVQYAMRYYEMEVEDDKGNMMNRLRIEWYDNQSVTFLIEDQNGNYVLDNSEEINPRYHGFKYIPLIPVENNSERSSDFAKVEEYIDKYDFLVSTSQDEIDNFRLAYLVLKGATLDDEEMERIKENGVFEIPDENGSISFLTKEVNDTFIENQKKTLNDNIFKFSASINMADENFNTGSAESGEARKWKLLALENKSIIKERKMTKALRELFKVVCSYWNVTGININYLDIYFTFSRNVPVDLLYLAEISANLKGMVSEDTRLSALSPLVDDVEWEKKKMAEDSAGIQLDDYESELPGVEV